MKWLPYPTVSSVLSVLPLTYTAVYTVTTSKPLIPSLYSHVLLIPLSVFCISWNCLPRFKIFIRKQRLGFGGKVCTPSCFLTIVSLLKTICVYSFLAAFFDYCRFSAVAFCALIDGLRRWVWFKCCCFGARFWFHELSGSRLG